MSEFKVFTKTSPDGIVLQVTDGTTIADAIDERRAVEIEHKNSEISALLEENYDLSCSKGERLRYEAVENGRTLAGEVLVHFLDPSPEGEGGRQAATFLS